MRRNKRVSNWMPRHKVAFYNIVPISGPNGSDYSYEHVFTDLFEKETQLQGSTYAELGGATITNQDCIFYGRSNSVFFPKKEMVCFNYVDGFWYKVLAPQPLEDPPQFYRFIAQRKEATFNPDVSTT